MISREQIMEEIEDIEVVLQEILIFPNQKGFERAWKKLVILFQREETLLLSMRRTPHPRHRMLLSETQARIRGLVERENQTMTTINNGSMSHVAVLIAPCGSC